MMHTKRGTITPFNEVEESSGRKIDGAHSASMLQSDNTVFPITLNDGFTLKPGQYQMKVSLRGTSGLVSARLVYDLDLSASDTNSIPLRFKRVSPNEIIASFSVVKTGQNLRLTEMSERVCDSNGSAQVTITFLPAWARTARTVRQAIFGKPLGSHRELFRFVWRVYRQGGLSAIRQAIVKYEAELKTAEISSKDYAGDFIDIPETVTGSMRPPSIGIHLHLFYPELADELHGYLVRIPFQFSLYVSVPTLAAKAIAEARFSNLSFATEVEVKVVPNRGRDIAPFVVDFAEQLRSHSVIAHIHSKRSLYNRGATDGWRQYLLSTLLPSSQGIRGIVQLLTENRAGIVFPQSFKGVTYRANTWLANYNLASTLSARLGVRNIPTGYFDFPVGSMFWCRSDAILPLFDASFTQSDFPEEVGQTDGTLAHCLERFLGVIPISQGSKLGILPDKVNPSWSKWRIEQYTNLSKSHYTSPIVDSATKIVAFDIFDTLLTRPLLFGDHVKHLLSSELAGRGIHNFREFRIRAEAEARKHKRSDPDLHEIYASLALLMPDVDVENIKEREIQLEVASVYPRAEVIELFQLAKEHGKRTILVSDMFLPRNVVETMLNRCGIGGWDALYVSSDVGVRKDQGEMFQFVLAKEKVRAREVLVIGDNEYADIHLPAELGFQTLHVMRPSTVLRAAPRLSTFVANEQDDDTDKQILFGTLAQKFYSRLDLRGFSPENMFGSGPADIGFGLLGPILVSFSDWLLKTSLKKRVDVLHFLAREGKILKEAFDIWVEGARNVPDSQYLVASRRSATVPALESIEDILRHGASNDFYDQPLSEFIFERFGLSLGESDLQALEDASLWERNRCVAVAGGNIDHLAEVLRALSPAILANAAIEKATLVRHLSAHGLGDSRKHAVVDVGYSATIQRSLSKVLGVAVDGFYMATEAEGVDKCRAVGLEAYACFAEAVIKGPAAVAIYSQSFVLEKLLSADEPQVIKFGDEEHPQPIYKVLSELELQAQDTRLEVQAAALSFVRAARRSRTELWGRYTIHPTLAANLFEKFVEATSFQERDILSSLALDDYYCGRGIVS